MTDKARVSIEQDLVFDRVGERELKCDVYTPPGAKGSKGSNELMPGVLLLHGGGWRKGDKAQLRGYGIQLALSGFVCVSSTYRLVGDTPWPAQIHDTKAAIRWMRAKAERLGIDQSKLAILGASAGAHLALLAAGTPGHKTLEGHGAHGEVDSSVAAVVGIFSPTVLAPRGKRLSGSVPGKSLLEDEDGEAEAALASPITHITKSYPPTFLIHGTSDKVVPPSASMRMYEALVQAGVPAELHMYAEQPHSFVAQKDFHRLSCREIILFLERTLGLRPKVNTSELPATARR